MELELELDAEKPKALFFTAKTPEEDEEAQPACCSFGVFQAVHRPARAKKTFHPPSLWRKLRARFVKDDLGCVSTRIQEPLAFRKRSVSEFPLARYFSFV